MQRAAARLNDVAQGRMDISYATEELERCVSPRKPRNVKVVEVSEGTSAVLHYKALADDTN